MTTEFRRKAPRRVFDGSVGALFHGHMTFSVCSQLGEGGALIAADGELRKVKQGDDMVITLYLPSIGGIVATAECVYRADNGKIGLQFYGLDMKYKKRIREFVSRRKTRMAAKK